MAKGNLILDKDLRSLFANLPDEQAGQLIKAAFACHDGEAVSIGDPILAAVYALIESKVLENDRRYEQRCEQNAKNRKRTETNVDERNESSTNVNERQQSGRNKNKKKEKENISKSLSNGNNLSDLNTHVIDISSEPSPKSAEPDLDLADVAAIILADGTEWRPTRAMYDTFVKAFPGVDVKAEFMKMRAWSDANPKNRKTWAGASRFANSWLAREQDRPKPKAVKRSQYDTAALEAALAWK